MCCATRERDKPPLFSSAKWLGKFNPKLQAFKRVLDLIFKYEEIEGAGQFNSLTGFQIFAL